MTSIREKGKARRRQRILDAARNILAEEGLEGLSTRKLADRAELSVHTLYKLLGNKDDILAEVMRVNHNVVEKQIRSTDEQDPIRRIFTIVQSTHDILEADQTQAPLMRVLMSLEDQHRSGDKIAQLMVRERGRFLKLVNLAIEKKILSDKAPGKICAEALDAVFLYYLRRHIWGDLSLAAFLRATKLGFWLILSGAAQGKWRAEFLRSAQSETPDAEF